MSMLKRLDRFEINYFLFYLLRDLYEFTRNSVVVAHQEIRIFIFDKLLLILVKLI